MSMRPSNDPDIAIAQEWAGELDAWFQRHGLCGYDPFDVKQHPWIRAVQPYPWPRRLSTLACDLLPVSSRQWMGVQPSENPKAHALLALGDLRMHELTGESRFLERAGQSLDWLSAHTTEGYHGPCWGYPFDVHAQGLDTPAGTPVLVVSAIAGEAFAAAHVRTGNPGYLSTARGIAEFMLHDLPRMEEPDGSYCFSYTPGDRRRVHNANLLAAEHLVRTGALCGDESLVAAAAPALCFTLSRQNPEGAWSYGEYTPGEPYDSNLLALVDHHHTGFVLRSLHTIHSLRPSQELESALRCGFSFYYQHLFQKRRMPVHAFAAYPVDIHTCAEGILCCSTLARRFPAAERCAIGCLRWTYAHLRDRKGPGLHYRRYPWFTSKIAFPRWGVAWMYRALCEYLAHFTARESDGMNAPEEGLDP